jgi:hypothetical protein
MSAESEIRNATKSGQERLWHHKGYYSVIVVSVSTLGGKEWVTYFIEQNCDLTLRDAEDAFIRANVGGETISAEELVAERHFEDNTLRVMSMDRAEAKFRKRKPAKPTPIKVTQL